MSALLDASMHELGLVAAVFAPLFAGLVVHGFWIRFGWLRSLAVPLDRVVVQQDISALGALLGMRATSR